MQLPSLSFTVLDTETTGFIPRVNRVIEFASVRVEGGTITDTYEQLFEIPVEIPLPVQVLTRIKQNALKDQPSLESRREEILKHIGSDTIIVGQNVSFDLKMLRGEGIDLTDRPWIDTSMLASLVFPELASYSLGYVSRILGLHHEPVHRALGDVHATLELLSRCWERLISLPPDLHAVALAIMERSAPGYRLLFDVLPPPTAKDVPSWLKPPPPLKRERVRAPEFAQAAFEKPKTGTVALVEEPLDPATLEELLHWAVTDPSTVQWIAVKNLDATLKRTTIPEGVRVLHHPSFLLDFEAAKVFAGQEVYTADESTLALKLAWYEPQTFHDLPIHGEERAIWRGKLACTDTSNAYVRQFAELPSVVLLDHRQLLHFLIDPAHAAHGSLRTNAHIIISDASMLEDTASLAYGWSCTLDDLRAASEGDLSLTRFTDLLQLWIEKVRLAQDSHPIGKQDLTMPEVTALKEVIDDLLSERRRTDTVETQLKSLRQILDPTLLPGRIAWIEQRQNGSQFIKSIPERISTILGESLFSPYPTTLLIPPASADHLPEILPQDFAALSLPTPVEDAPPSISVEPSERVESFLETVPQGKTIILVPSRRVIEGFFITHTEKLETKGVTLICQNLSGGQERMQAEFLAAPSPCLWLLTPWTYEGVELPLGSVDHLIIQSLPFDHPSYPVTAKRCEHYRNAFDQYTMPRLRHRLFRLLRTFCRHRTKAGDVRVLDERLETKEYGRGVAAYLRALGGAPSTKKPLVPQKKEGKELKPISAKKPPTKKEPPHAGTKDQLSLF